MMTGLKRTLASGSGQALVAVIDALAAGFLEPFREDAALTGHARHPDTAAADRRPARRELGWLRVARAAR